MEREVRTVVVVEVLAAAAAAVVVVEVLAQLAACGEAEACEHGALVNNYAINQALSIHIAT